MTKEYKIVSIRNNNNFQQKNIETGGELLGEDGVLEMVHVSIYIVRRV